jgi:hypothetical protein
MWKKIIVVFALTFSLAAQAQDAELVFRALDENGDGQLTQREAQANELVSANFSGADMNSDARLSLAEFTAAFGAG